MKRRTFLKLGTGTVLGGGLAACGNGSDDHSGGSPPGGGPGGGVTGPVVQPWEGNVVTGWTEQALQAIRASRPGTPMVARSLAILYNCMYNAWCAYDAVALPTTTSPVTRQPGAECTGTNKAMAISYAAWAALSDQLPSQKAAFDAYMKQLGYDPSASGSAAGQPARLGTDVAKAEIAYCHNDGANQLGDMTSSGVPYADYTGYVAKNPPLIVPVATPLSQIPAPGHWQPLSYPDATGVMRTPSFLGAQWQRLKPFAMTSSSQFRAGPPVMPGTAAYLDQVRRIVDVQAALTEEQKVIVEFWADYAGTEQPPGHWCRFGLYVSQRDAHTLDEDVKMFFALGNSLEDAAIAAWDVKRAYDSERPITAVRYALHGQTITGYGALGPPGGLRSILADEWTPYQQLSFPTPPFPEHVSGHSTFSAAAAEVLRLFTGSDAFNASATVIAGSMTTVPDMPAKNIDLSWATFTAAAEQAGISRIYGGIHFDNANLGGLAIGHKVGQAVFDKAQRMWQGKA